MASERGGRVRVRLALAGLLVAAGCGGGGTGAERESSPQRPVLVIGVDGLEWSVTLPLVQEGRMPHLRALMERGVYGLFPTLEPTKSPVIWTSIATGKAPREHGIRRFTKPGRPGEPPQLYTSLDRRTKALWNIASDYGKRVAVVGWWMTFPVEPVNGVMVAQTNTLAQIEIEGGQNIWKGRLVEDLEGQVWPPDRAPEVMGVLAETEADLDRRLEEIFGTFPHPLSLLGERLWENCRWAFRADATYLAVAESLLAEEPPFDLAAVYFGGPDVVGHRFWRYRRPAVFAHRPTPEEIENFGGVVEDYYAWTDRAIGRLVDRAAPATRVFVVSDHGMEPANVLRRFDADDPPHDVNSGHHWEAPAGVIVAAGPGLERSGAAADLDALAVEDLAPLSSVMALPPTLLALMDVPVGRDFAERPTAELLGAGPTPRWVETHDDAAWLERHRARRADDSGSAERLEQLRELGYLEDESGGQ